MVESILLCPVCEQLKADEFDLLVTANGRCYASGVVPPEVLELGFCNHHGWMAAQVADPATAALIFSRLLRRRVEQPTLISRCFACLRLREREYLYLQRLSSPSGPEVLCVPHLQRWLAWGALPPSVSGYRNTWAASADQLEQRRQEHRLRRYGRDPLLLQTVRLTLGRMGDYDGFNPGGKSSR